MVISWKKHTNWLQSDVDNVSNTKKKAYIGIKVVFYAHNINFKHKMYQSTMMSMNGKLEIKVVQRIFEKESKQKVKSHVVIVCSLPICFSNEIQIQTNI